MKSTLPSPRRAEVTSTNINQISTKRYLNTPKFSLRGPPGRDWNAVLVVSSTRNQPKINQTRRFDTPKYRPWLIFWLIQGPQSFFRSESTRTRAAESATEQHGPLPSRFGSAENNRPAFSAQNRSTELSALSDLAKAKKSPQLRPAKGKYKSAVAPMGHPRETLERSTAALDQRQSRAEQSRTTCIIRCRRIGHRGKRNEADRQRRGFPPTSRLSTFR